MIKLLKILLKSVAVLLLIPVLYLIVSFILMSITVNKSTPEDAENVIYLNTNGVHLDVIIKKKDLPFNLKKGMRFRPTDNYFAFGWGEEDFYVNTPDWSDLKFTTAFKALFLENTTLVHMARYNRVRSDWVEVKVTDDQLKSIINYVSETFAKDENGDVIILPGKGYKSHDDFYKANGSYSLFFTCNSWVNNGFKQSGIKSCFWTPFDFGLLGKYD
ncbi:MAG: DUF2459 domain-containing protein [bacterium]|nr:DUF2459 domain-containing protein [bacterium]